MPLARTMLLAPALAVTVQAASAQPTAPPTWAARVDSVMRAEMARANVPGAQIAVVERGRLAYTRGYGVADVETGRPVTDRTLFQTGSLSKLFTAVLLAELASRGVVDLRSPVSRYVPELAGRVAGTATVHEMLTHSAGWVQLGEPVGRSDDAALGEAWRAVGDTIAVPGLRGIYSYANGGFAMAAYTAERAARRPFATLLDSLVLRPLGMARSNLRPMVAMTYDFALGYATPPSGPAPVVVRPMPGNSAEWGAGHLYTNAAEAARLGIAMMDGGVREDARVLSADAVRAVTGAHVPRGGSRVLFAGYGMNTDSVGGRRVWQKGGAVDGYRALMTMWPADKLAVVVLTNRISELTFNATAAAANIVAGIAPPTPEPAAAERDPTPAERVALAGDYRRPRNPTIELRETGGRLELRRPASAAPVRMRGPDRFVATPPGGRPAEFVVVRDSVGAVRYLQGAGEVVFLRFPIP